MIEVYTTTACPRCTIIKGLLIKKKVEFVEHQLVTDEQKEAFKATFNVREVPFVVFNSHPIGGAKAAADWIAVSY